MKKKINSREENLKREISLAIAKWASLQTLMYLSLLIILASGVTAQVSITAVTIPRSIDEGASLEISFEAKSNGTNLSYEIYADGYILSGTNHHSEILGYNSSGRREYSFIARDNESAVIENRTLMISNVPLNIQMNSPSERVYISQDVAIDIDINQDQDASCSYKINNQSSLSGNLTRDQTNFFSQLQLPDGNYALSITCITDYDVAQRSVLFSIDSRVPVIIAKSYSIDQDYAVTLSLSTSIDSRCKYDIKDGTYESMAHLFSQSGSLQHSTKIPGLPEGAYTYYVLCRSVSGRDMGTSEIVSFSIQRKPSASIKISGGSPLRAGTYTVELTTSEDVQDAPLLNFNFHNDESKRTISLSGSASKWSGYMIIDENTPNKVGTFHFSAKDFTGTDGNKITSGELFLVDTTRPPIIESIEANTKSDGSIILQWHYDGESPHHYNIYRSDSNEIGYVDFYEKIDAANLKTKKFVDNDVDSGATYYYSVTAVDEAGNEADIGTVVSAIPYSEEDGVNDGTAGDTVAKPLSLQLQKKIDAQIKEIEQMVLSIQSRQADMNAENDPVKLKVLSMTNALQESESAVNELQERIAELESLKQQDISDSQAEISINRIRMDSVKSTNKVLEEILIVEKGNYDQLLLESDIDTAIGIITEGINISKKALDNYSLESKRIQDFIGVRTEVISFKVMYMGKEDYSEFTFVKKIITSSSEISDVILVENIPKEVERKASNILFSEIPEIVREDPVVKWHIDKLSVEELSYRLTSIVDLVSLKNTRTIILKKPDFRFSDTDSSNAIPATGMLSYELVSLNNMGLMQWLLIIGIGIVLGLSVYYFVILESKEKRIVKNRSGLQHPMVNNVQDTAHKSNSGVNRVENRSSGIVKHTRENYSSANNGKVSQNSSRKSAIVREKGITPHTSVSFAPANNSSVAISNNSFAQPAFNIGKDSITAGKVFSRQIQYCNDAMNRLDYESARKLYSQCLTFYKDIGEEDKEEARKTLSHVYAKMQSYRHVYNARRYLYQDKKKDLEASLKNIDSCYSQIAYNMGFLSEEHKAKELEFLEYIAESKNSLERHS